MERDPLQAAKNEAHEQAEHLGDAAKQAGQDIRDGVRDGVDAAAAAAERAAADVQSGAAELKNDATAQVNKLADQAAAQAGAALTATGQSLDSLAQTVRSNAPSGAVGEYAQSTATAIEKGADYLKQADVNDVWQDAAQFVRRRPLSTLLVTLGVGYLLARAVRR